jgi:hypothetical protein
MKTKIVATQLGFISSIVAVCVAACSKFLSLHVLPSLFVVSSFGFRYWSFNTSWIFTFFNIFWYQYCTHYINKELSSTVNLSLRIFGGTDVRKTSEIGCALAIIFLETLMHKIWCIAACLSVFELPFPGKLHVLPPMAFIIQAFTCKLD